MTTSTLTADHWAAIARFIANQAGEGLRWTDEGPTEELLYAFRGAKSWDDGKQALMRLAVALTNKGPSPSAVELFQAVAGEPSSASLLSQVCSALISPPDTLAALLNEGRGSGAKTLN